MIYGLQTVHQALPQTGMIYQGVQVDYRCPGMFFIPSDIYPSHHDVITEPKYFGNYFYIFIQA